MKLWCATYHDDDSASGTVQLFAPSERKVRTLLAEAKDLEPSNFHVYSVKRMEVPTTAQELCDWLNIYCKAGAG